MMIVGKGYKFKSEQDQIEFAKQHDCNKKYTEIISNSKGGIFIVTGGTSTKVTGEEVGSVAYATDIDGNEIKPIDGYLIVNGSEMKFFVEAELPEKSPIDHFVKLSMENLLAIYMRRNPMAVESKITVSGLRRWYEECKKEVEDLEKEINNTEVKLIKMKAELQESKELLK